MNWVEWESHLQQWMNSSLMWIYTGRTIIHGGRKQTEVECMHLDLCLPSFFSSFSLASHSHTCCCVFGGPIRLHITISCRVRLLFVHVLERVCVCVRASLVYYTHSLHCHRVYTLRTFSPIQARLCACMLLSRADARAYASADLFEGEIEFSFSCVRCVRYALQARACELSSVYVALRSYFCFFSFASINAGYDEKSRALGVNVRYNVLWEYFFISFTYDFPRTHTNTY